MDTVMFQAFCDELDKLGANLAVPGKPVSIPTAAKPVSSTKIQTGLTGYTPVNTTTPNLNLQEAGSKQIAPPPVRT